MTPPTTADAFAAIVRARALVADLDLSRRATDLSQTVAAVRAELQTALCALEAGLTADTPGAVRFDARWTSQEAAITVRTGTSRGRVLIALWRRGPLTDHEIQQALNLPPSTERPRRGELVRAGYVTPDLIMRQHNGRQWTVWRLTPAGEVMARTLDATPGVALAPVERLTQGTLL